MLKRFTTISSLAILLATLVAACGGVDSTNPSQDTSHMPGDASDLRDLNDPSDLTETREDWTTLDLTSDASDLVETDGDTTPACVPACAEGFECQAGQCVELPFVCDADVDCADRCEGLTACEACTCGDVGACVAEAVEGCCLDDAYCDPATQRCVDGECVPLPLQCNEAEDPDATCVGECGMMGVCTTCWCNMDSGACEPVEELGDHCCKTLEDCDDDNSCTSDTCPTPGAACSHVFMSCPCDSWLDQVLLYVDFDQGAMLPWFTVSYDNDPYDNVTWQLSSFDTHSGSYAAYFGDPVCQTYYSGALVGDCQLPDLGEDGTAGVVTGTLRSEDFTLTDACVYILSFWTRFEGEPTWLGMEEYMPDQLKVYVSEGPNRTRVFASALVNEDNHTEGEWRFYVADLTAWYGKTIRVEFEFDTYDGADNFHFGVLLDDVQVRSVPEIPSVGPCDAFNPCPDDGDPCTEDECTFFVNDNTGKGLCAYFKPDPECDPCTTDGDCYPGGDCETGACQDGLCVYEPQDDCFGVDLPPCDDGDDCTADACVSGVCEYQPIDGPGCCYSDVLTAEDFESGSSEVSLSDPSDEVKWQVLSTADGGKAQSGDFALYFGDIETMGYDAPGQPVAGEAAWQIMLPDTEPGEAPFVLSWWQHLDLDPGDQEIPVSDRFTVIIEDPNAGTSVVVFSNKAPTYSYYGQWHKQSVSLEAYAGKSIFILFQFMSGDAIENDDGEGVYIDSLRVHKDCDSPS